MKINKKVVSWLTIFTFVFTTFTWKMGISTKGMDTAVDLTNVPEVWNEFKYRGEGMVISVIDDGLDYDHKDMRISDDVDVKLTEEIVKEIGGGGKYFSRKIPYGYNFGDENFNIKDQLGIYHGTHVGGIIAANGSDEEVNAEKAIDGVAPEAQLLAMKDYSDNIYSGNSFALEKLALAIEDSIVHRADVINMSKGGGVPYDDFDDVVAKAVNKAVHSGVVVVAAAGNGSYSTKGYDLDVLDKGTLGLPGIDKNVIAVACYENDYKKHIVLNYVSNKENGFISYNQPFNLLNEPVETLNKKEYAVSLSENVDNKSDLKDKIVIMEKIEDYEDKVLEAQEAGAVAAIVCNTKEMGETIRSTFLQNNISIPVALLSYSDGIRLRDNIDSGLKIKFAGEIKSIPNYMKDRISQFSAWGPTPDLNLKPDITAPGGGIWSTKDNNQYVGHSGTSMASPHAAGVMALILQRIKDSDIKFKNEYEKVNFARAMAMNTANVIIDPDTEGVPYSPRRQGVGLIDAEAAVKNLVTVTHLDENNNVALKEIKDTVVTFNLNLTNYGDKDAVYKVKKLGGVLTEGEKLGKGGMPTDEIIKNAKIKFSKDKITVPAKKKVSLKVTIELPEKLAKNKFIEGFIRFESEHDKIPSIGIPYMGFYGEWDKGRIIDKPAWDNESKLKKTMLITVDEYNNESILGLVGQDENGDKIIDEDKIAVNGSENIVPRVTLLRNAKNVDVSIVNDKDELMRDIIHDKNVDACVLRGYEDYKDMSQWAWNGKIYNSSTGEIQCAKDGQYYYLIKSRVDYEDSQYQTLKIPVKVDTVKPKIYNAILEENKISFKAFDKLSGIESFKFKIDGEFYKDSKGNSEFKLEPDKNGVYSIEFEDFTGYEVSIYAKDYAKNISEYTDICPLDDTLEFNFNCISDYTQKVYWYCVNSNKINIKGYVTKPVKTFKIMDKDVKVNEDLSFNVDIDLPNEGINKIRVYGESKDGQIRDCIYRILCDLTPPEIDFNIPKEIENTGVVYVNPNDEEFILEGKIRDNSGYAEIFINGNSVKIKNADKEGWLEFHSTIKLNETVTLVKVQANDDYKNKSEKTFVIIKDSSKKH